MILKYLSKRYRAFSGSVFWEALGLFPVGRRLGIIAALFAYSIADLLSIGMLLPLIGLAMPDMQARRLTPIIGDFFDFLGMSHSLSTVIILYCMLVVLKAFFSVLLMNLTSSAVSNLTRSFQNRIAVGIIKSRWSWLQKQSVARLIQVAGREASLVGEMFHNAANLVAMSLQVVAYLLLSFLFSWQAAMLGIALSGFTFIWLNGIFKIRKLSSQTFHETTTRLAANISDLLTNIRSVRGMGRTKLILDTMAGSSGRVQESLRRKLVMSDLSSEILEPITAIFIAVWFYLAIVEWEIEFHKLFIVGLIIIRASTILFGMYRVIFRVIDATPIFRNVMKTLSVIEESGENFHGRQDPQFNDAIKLDHVTFAFGEKKIFQDFSAEFKASSISLIKGKSGIGKSTLLDLILAFQKPSSGSVLVDGMDLYEEINVEKWRNLIGYVPQEQTLINASIRENLLLGYDRATDEDIWAALEIARIRDFVEALPEKINAIVGERGTSISGGQRQRLMIARALISQPKILLLDEITSAIDVATELDIISAIAELNEREKITVIVVSHNNAWANVSDNVVEI